jgi:hypothetical protein
LEIFKKGLAFLLVGALGLLASPGPGRAQAVTPLVDLGSDVWRFSVSDGCLLGGKMGERWLKPGEIAPLLRGGEIYRLYTLTRFIGTACGSKPEKTGDPGVPDYIVQMKSLPSSKDMLAVGGRWNALLRAPRLAGTDRQVYREAVAEVLKKKGLQNPRIKITQVIRIDLDGDGVEEVLITADTYGKQLYRHLQKKGSYSLVLLRKLIQGKVHNLVIEEDHFPSTREYAVPYRFWVAGVLDVDGDGVMEIILHGMYYEGGGASVYRVEGDKIIKVLTAGWGV